MGNNFTEDFLEIVPVMCLGYIVFFISLGAFENILFASIGACMFVVPLISISVYHMFKK